MKNRLFFYSASWIWFIVGLLAVGLSADYILGAGSRNFWGAIGGVTFVGIGGWFHKRRQRKVSRDST